MRKFTVELLDLRNEQVLLSQAFNKWLYILLITFEEAIYALCSLRKLLLLLLLVNNALQAIYELVLSDGVVSDTLEHGQRLFGQIHLY